jgi:lysophospholipase L1-like esterase
MSRWVDDVLGLVPKPTTVIVEIGVNDLFCGVTADDYADAYKHLMYSGIDAGVKVLLMTVPPTLPSWTWHDQHNPLRQGVNAWMRSYFGLDNLIDIDSGLRVGASGDADPCYYLINGAGDGLHPNTLGALRIADWINIARII